jgi:hypothetical protein
MNCNPTSNVTNIKIHNPSSVNGYTASFDTAFACPKSPFCTVTAEDMSSYDLRGIPMISGRDPNDAYGWTYAVDICSSVPFGCSVCGNQSVYCQVSPSLNPFFCVGSINNVTLRALSGSRGVVATVTSPPGVDGRIRSGTVTMNCNPTATNVTNINFHNPNNLDGYSLSFDSAMACAKPPSCTIISTDGYIYNLTGIPTIAGRDPNDTFGWNFRVNLCSPLPMTCDICGIQSAYCQVSPSRTRHYCVGSISSVKLVGFPGGRGVIGYVSSTSPNGDLRSGNVTMLCNPNAIQPNNVQVFNPSTLTDFAISFESALACPLIK